MDTNSLSQVTVEIDDPESLPTHSGLKRMFDFILVKFPHPITNFNPTEWNQITQVRIEDKKIWVRSDDSAWFNLARCEVKKK